MVARNCLSFPWSRQYFKERFIYKWAGRGAAANRHGCGSYWTLSGKSPARSAGNPFPPNLPHSHPALHGDSQPLTVARAGKVVAELVALEKELAKEAETASKDREKLTLADLKKL